MFPDKFYLRSQENRTSKLWPDWRKATVGHKEAVKRWYRSRESSAKIAGRIGVHQETVLKWLKRMRVKIRGRSEATHLSRTSTFHWTKKQLEVLEGELLGDGCLQKYVSRPLGNYYFIMCTSSRGHALYLKGVLPKGLFADNSPWLSKDGYWNLKSRSAPKLTELRKKWYLEGRKVVPRDLELTPTVCYYWYVGDGCLEKSWGAYRIRFSTEGFDEESIQRVRRRLAEKGFRARVWSAGMSIKDGAGLRVFLSTKDTSQFLKWIGKPKIQDYGHKWI